MTVPTCGCELAGFHNGDPDTGRPVWEFCPLHKAAPSLLHALDACETVLTLQDRSCGDLPPSGERCGECLGCGMEAALEHARDAIKQAEGEA